MPHSHNYHWFDCNEGVQDKTEVGENSSLNCSNSLPILISSLEITTAGSFSG